MPLPRTANWAAGEGPAVRAALVCTVWCLWFPGAIGAADGLLPADAPAAATGQAPPRAELEIELVGAKTPAEANDDRIRVLQHGSSSASARKAATPQLPLDRMSPSGRQRAEELLQNVSLFRELPLLTFDVNPAVYRFFTMYPDVAVSIWRVLRISEFQMWQTGPNEYEADAGDGTTGTIDVLYRSPDEQVILCDGMLMSPILSKTIRASALMHLRSSFAAGPDGRQHVTSRLCLYVSFPSQTIEVAAKLISPLANVIIDRNFSEVSLFVYMMSLAMERQPGWVEQLAGRLEGVLEIRKSQLVDLTAQVYVEARRRELGDAGPDAAGWPRGAASPLSRSARQRGLLPAARQPALRRVPIPQTAERIATPHAR